VEYIKQIAMNKCEMGTRIKVLAVHGKVQSQTLPVKEIIHIDDFCC
jgi:hypothetical protein